MQATERFLNLMNSLWQKLSQLEFIGQHKESVIVSERMQQTASKKEKKKEWSIFG